MMIDVAIALLLSALADSPAKASPVPSPSPSGVSVICAKCDCPLPPWPPSCVDCCTKKVIALATEDELRDVLGLDADAARRVMNRRFDAKTWSEFSSVDDALTARERTVYKEHVRELAASGDKRIKAIAKRSPGARKFLIEGGGVGGMTPAIETARPAIKEGKPLDAHPSSPSPQP